MPGADPDADKTPQGGPIARPGRVRRAVWIALVPIVAYLGLTALVYALQGQLIFPGQATQGHAGAAVDPPPDAELLTLRAAGGERVVALFGPALTPDGRPRPDAAARPTLLYFYGNGMSLADSGAEFARFRRLGANVLIPDYLGYGLSGGHAGEAGCYAAADAAYAHLRSRPDVDPGRIVAGGWSLGAAVAADLAAREPVAGLVLFSPFTSMVDMAHGQFPYLPVGLLLRHRFETERKLAGITCPVLIGHGHEDSLIPHAMSDRLAAAAAGPVSRLTIDGADHNDLFQIGGTEIDEALARFLASLD